VSELSFDFSVCGGVRTVAAGGDPDDPKDVAWNFGLAAAGQPVAQLPSLYAAFPNVRGRWDGKTSVNHHNAVRKVLGKNIEAQYQSTGTCGGRAGSRSSEIAQCIAIAAGQRAKFKYVSHAWPYYLARREYGMLGRGDGVAEGSIPPAMAKYGLLNREESGDLKQNGDGNDDVAAAWGGGRLAAAKVREFEQLASDNLVVISAKVGSAEEMADGIAAGGVGIVADSRGYSMTRDADGFCRPSGTWYHYHVRSGVRVTGRGRKGFDYNQSWGQNTPSGPLLDGCPDNCFGVDWDVDDANYKSGAAHVLFGISLWDLEKGGIDISWSF